MPLPLVLFNVFPLHGAGEHFCDRRKPQRGAKPYAHRPSGGAPEGGPGGGLYCGPALLAPVRAFPMGVGSPAASGCPSTVHRASGLNPCEGPGRSCPFSPGTHGVLAAEAALAPACLVAVTTGLSGKAEGRVSRGGDPASQGVGGDGPGGPQVRQCQCVAYVATAETLFRNQGSAAAPSPLGPDAACGVSTGCPLSHFSLKSHEHLPSSPHGTDSFPRRSVPRSHFTDAETEAQCPSEVTVPPRDVRGPPSGMSSCPLSSAREIRAETVCCSLRQEL